MLDGYDNIPRHAEKRKERFDKRVEGTWSSTGAAVFEPGDSVQVYRSDMDYTFRVERKMVGKWSDPKKVVRKFGTSYELETLKGEVVEGRLSSRRLRRFHPREGTNLFEEERERRKKIEKESKSDRDLALFRRGYMEDESDIEIDGR
jgi:hypothetical protein